MNENQITANVILEELQNNDILRRELALLIGDEESILDFFVPRNESDEKRIVIYGDPVSCEDDIYDSEELAERLVKSVGGSLLKARQKVTSAHIRVSYCES